MTILKRAWRSLRFRSKRFAYDVRQALFAGRLTWRRPRRLRDSIDDGVTIVTVSWNTLSQLQTLLRAVDQFTDSSVKLIVVDNASSDGTAEFLRNRSDLRSIVLKRNWGHGLALDTAVQAARTRFVVTLDVDAFPISGEWLQTVIEPLRSDFTLAGAFSSGYIHPCYMAIERHRFLEAKHTFAASYSRRLRFRRKGLPKGWDAGKLITVRDNGPHYHVDATSVRGPGALGTVFGGVVYHHFYSTRLTGSLTADVVRSGVTPEISQEAWREAVARYLPPRS